MKKPIKTTIVTSFLLFAIFAMSPPFQYSQVKPLYSYYNMFHGARSIGMGNAFTAVANDLTAVFRNPAGIAELKGPQVFIDYRKDTLEYLYESQTQTTGSSTQQYDSNFNSSLKNLDFLSISVPVTFWDMQWAVALSYYRYIPYGFDGSSVGVVVTDADTSTADTTSLTLTGNSGIDVLAFTSAFHLTDYLSFGVTFQLFFNSGNIVYDYSSTALSYQQEFTDKILDQNFVIGLLVKLSPQISLGFNYNTQYSGIFSSAGSYQETGSTTTTTASTRSSLLVPAQIAFGLQLKPYPFMSIAVDLSKRYWSRSTITDYYSTPGELEFPVRGDFAFSQDDVVNYRIGVELNAPFPKGLFFLRGGYFSDQQLFVDANSGAVKFKGYSLGAGVELSSIVRLDAAFMRQKGTWKETGYFDSSGTVDTT
ncbi:MAG: hypothetical protein GY940_36535, partial [bacterium]|nr:hypothetical protein [bacterium]